MDKLIRDLRHFYFINGHDPKQIGGPKHEFVYNGHKIYYDTSISKYNIGRTIVIDGGRDAGRRPCFQLTILNKSATLQSLERGTDCFVDRHDNTRDLVLTAFHLAKQKGSKVFELVDNSFKSCPPYKFCLSDVYFLTHGQTWYESILPIKIKSRDESELNVLRTRAQTTTWSSVATYLATYNVILDLDYGSIDINEPGSAMKVLRQIKTMKNDLSCKFFAENTNRILFISNIPSFHGSLWSL
jgi:hypothetical protein